MKVMVVGGGGREHAIIRKLKENPTIEKLYALPGNGGIAADAKLLSAGGRVLGAVAVADGLPEAVTKAYALADRIHFENAFCRRDIGKKALAAEV